MALIEPRTLKGFRDYLPEAMIPREKLIETARAVYRSYGFLPIDTPALEYEEILTGKGGTETDKQLYRFEDHGGRRVALRFDLTVPLARFVAQYSNDLGLPFKRYHIASVWRGENTQRGRYREFMQCDFDTIGVDGVAADIEMVLVINDLMQQLGFGARAGEREFKIRLNNRKILNGFMEGAELQEHSPLVLRALDKIDKIGQGGVATEICKNLETTLGSLSSERQSKVERFVERAVQFSSAVPTKEHLGNLRNFLGTNAIGLEGLERIETIVDSLASAGVPHGRVLLDCTIARGLDYYTGTIVETVLDDLPTIGSVCSGGRYDNLAQLYTNQRLPGIGASLGLDRLLAAMEELHMLEKRRSSAPIFVPFFDAQHLNDYLKLCANLRRSGLGIEFYPEPKKLGAQLKYADRRGFKVAVIIGDDEWKNGTCQVKELSTQASRSIPLTDLERELKALTS